MTSSKDTQERTSIIVVGGDGHLHEAVVAAPLEGLGRAGLDEARCGQGQFVSQLCRGRQHPAETILGAGAGGILIHVEQSQTTATAVEDPQGVVDEGRDDGKRSQHRHARLSSVNSACIRSITRPMVSRSIPSVSSAPSASCGMRRSPPLPKPSARTSISARCTAAVRCA